MRELWQALPAVAAPVPDRGATLMKPLRRTREQLVETKVTPGVRDESRTRPEQFATGVAASLVAAYRQSNPLGQQSETLARSAAGRQAVGARERIDVAARP
jgi:hypothetical protein